MLSDDGVDVSRALPVPPGGEASVVLGPYRLTALEVRPETTTAGPIPQSDYAATVVLGLLSPPPPGSSGVQGVVSLGPLCPVQRVGLPCPDRPFEATFVLEERAGRRGRARRRGPGRPLPHRLTARPLHPRPAAGDGQPAAVRRPARGRDRVARLDDARRHLRQRDPLAARFDSAVNRRVQPVSCAPRRERRAGGGRAEIVTDPDSLTAADLEEMFEKVSNWGRWGPEDERGALNLITDEQRAAAAALVTEGVAVSCALELPKTPAPDNPTPVRHTMIAAGDVGGLASLDYFAIGPHGFATTHLDALCHVFHNGKMYNGFDQSEVTSSGARRNSIMAGKDGIVSRGVLLDIAALEEVPYLDLDRRIGVSELEAAEEREGVRVSEGDILLVGTGRDARRDEHGPWSPMDEGLAGLAPECIPWTHERGVAVIGCDGITDASPSKTSGWRLPYHEIAIVSMGVHLIDNMQLGRLAAACAERGRWEFLLTVAPLRLDQGTASPVNPIAMF